MRRKINMNNNVLNETNTESNMENILLNNDSGKTKVYVSHAEKYADVSSSAATFLLVGGVGLIAIILLMTGIISPPVSLTPFFYVVMTGVFALFIIIGIASLINAASLKKKIATDIETSSRIKTWLKENISAENINSLISDEISEDEKFFERTGIIKEKIALSEYADTDEAYIDALIEDFYNDIF